MTRSALFLLTAVTVLLTALVLQAGLLPRRPGRLAALRRGALLTPAARAEDPLTSDAAWRYRHCQANHWRACLLQH
jgi:hypothetical protein